MRDICFVTGNQNKFVEVKKLIKNFNLISNSDLNIDEEIPETKNTIKGNSFLKSNYVHKKFGLSCFADDSGLFIKALNGDPGVKSARYASDKSDSDLNIDLVLKNLKRETNRDAYFETYICLIINDDTHYFKGTIHGRISNERLGSAGFGYDPIFIPDGYKKSFAQMTLDEKNKISHRAIAIKKLVNFLNEQ